MTKYSAYGREISIGGLDSFGQLDFIESPLFKNWISSVSDAIQIKSVTILSIDHKPDGQIIFAKVAVEAYNAKNLQILPNVIFLRGGSVAILPVLVAQETGKKYTILTKQTRLPVGEDELTEIPAGMVDGSNNFIGVAAREFKEETGMDIALEELICLTPANNSGVISFPKPIAVSPGACDETMGFYLFLRGVPMARIEELQGRLTGNREEGEAISLWIVELDRAPYVTRDMKFFTAYALATLQGVL